MTSRILRIFAITMTIALGLHASARAAGFDKSIEGLERHEGFIDLYVSVKDNKVFAALPAADANGVSLTTIYATGLTAGLGSNPIGLDRGAFDSGIILSFRQIGNKIIAEHENWDYRASADRALEKRAVRESFARSFLWATDIIATGKNGEMLINLSGFLTRDHFGSVAAIKSNPKGGAYSIASDRSMPDAKAVLVFPDNVELDAYLTLTTSEPGREVRVTAADGRAITLVQHHSFIRLPGAGYTPRIFDPRTGAIEVAYYDFSSALDKPIVTKLARRFRLQRQDANLPSGPVKKPIIFYVDPGAPEQIRNALIEGASWWKDAFTAAGFDDAYRVEVLPEGAHPFDVRYNMIQWTHRQTRGWSYGGGIYDPRTGEMIKANVILGSQRVRQDRMIFEGLAGIAKSGTGAPDDPVQIALARIRQLAAHEVGHTLGFAHNFAASSNDRASVMDYPAPYIRPTDDGRLDFSDAYAIGVGAWDAFAATWLYAQFPPGTDKKARLNTMVADAYNAGLRYVADREGRSVGTANPYGSVWDNGSDAITALKQTLDVRKIALDSFGTRSLQSGQPIADLNTIIVPVYLYHRYQIAAAAKLVGGLNFTYGIMGDISGPASPIAPKQQRSAMNALVGTLDPALLDLPDTLINQLVPAAGGFGGFGIGGENFTGKTGPVFDVLNAAQSSASLTLGALLHPARAARLVAFHRRDASALGLTEMLDAIDNQVFKNPAQSRHTAIAHVLQARFISALMGLSANKDASIAVRTATDAKLARIQNRLKSQRKVKNSPRSAHNAWLSAQISSHFNRASTSETQGIPVAKTPPGSPIGSTEFMETCWHCDAP